MSRSDQSFVRIGCPWCESTVDAAVPPGAGIVEPDEDETVRLRGKEAYCASCGNELELYFF